MSFRLNKQHFSDPFVIGSYRRSYNGYSPVSHLLNARLARVKELLGNVFELNILDVGCGIGVIGTHILKNGGRYFAVDLSEGMLRECQCTLEKEDRLFMSQVTIDQLPFLNESFDRVLCLGSMEYAGDIEVAAAELARVLQEKGVAIVTMQNPFGIYRFWENHVYSSRLFNMVRKMRGKPAVGGKLEKVIPQEKIREVFALHGLIGRDFVYYNFDVFVKPLDHIFPRLSVKVSNVLEFLGRNALGIVLAADFIISFQKVIL
jgi:ubiquinone/menaquinone biosynthesis C-methylase UbiE